MLPPPRPLRSAVDPGPSSCIAPRLIIAERRAEATIAPERDAKRDPGSDAAHGDMYDSIARDVRQSHVALNGTMDRAM